MHFYASINLTLHEAKGEVFRVPEKISTRQRPALCTNTHISSKWTNSSIKWDRITVAEQFFQLSALNLQIFLCVASTRVRCHSVQVTVFNKDFLSKRCGEADGHSMGFFKAHVQMETKVTTLRCSWKLNTLNSWKNQITKYLPCFWKVYVE